MWRGLIMSKHIWFWNKHIFMGDSIRVPSCEHLVGSEIFIFIIQIYTPLPVPQSWPITSLEHWPIRPFPSPNFIEGGNVRISSTNLYFTWLIEIYLPNPSLVGIILAFKISSHSAFSGSPKWNKLRFWKLNQLRKHFLGRKLEIICCTRVFVYIRNYVINIAFSSA